MTIPRPLPTQEELRRLFDYEPLSGILRWKSRPDRSVQHNGRWAGEIAGGLHPLGYYVVRFAGRRYLAHRLVWKLVYDQEPASIDHANGDGTDNRLCNLRACSHQENMRNTAGWARKALPKGVHRRADNGRFRAIICVAGKNISLGTFCTEDAAAFAYAEASKSHHGEFGRTK